jgi:hypothetical protein
LASLFSNATNRPAVPETGGPLFVLDAVLEDGIVSLLFDGLKHVDGPSKLGDFHYIPVLTCLQVLNLDERG